MPPAEADRPIDAGEGEHLLAPLAASSGAVLAVSGGADSLALMVCAARWREARPDVPLHVLTVDHRLRPEAGDEARRVADLARRHGLPARVLTRDGPGPQTGIEAAAREARYRLLFAAARDLGCDHIVTAHHRDDVAETFLMRLSRGAGVFGLAAMRPRIDVDGVTLFRPFLDISRSRLAATARALDPVDDPMNRDPAFLRARVRAALPLLADFGLPPDSLAEAAHRLAAAAEAIDAWVGEIMRDSVTISSLAVVTVDAAAFDASPGAVRFRLMERVLTAAGGGDAPPRFASLEALCVALAAGDAPARTLGGALVDRRGDRVTVCREPGRLAAAAVPVPPGRPLVWDRRFVVETPEEGVTVAPLGADGLESLGSLAEFGHVPRAALLALPAFRRGGAVVATPVPADHAGAPPYSVREVVGARLAQPPLFPSMDPPMDPHKDPQ